MTDQPELFIFEDRTEKAIEKHPEQKDAILEAKAQFFNSFYKVKELAKTDPKTAELLERIPAEIRGTEKEFEYYLALIMGIDTTEANKKLDITPKRRTRNKALDNKTKLLNSVNSNSLAILSESGYEMAILDPARTRGREGFLLHIDDIPNFLTDYETDIKEPPLCISNKPKEIKPVQDIDLRPLKVIYSMLLKEIEARPDELKQIVTDGVNLYVPDIYNYMYKDNKAIKTNNDSLPIFVKKIYDLQQIQGYIRTEKAFYSVINVAIYKLESNTMTIKSEYLNYILNKKIEEKENEEKRRLLNSYMITTDITKEKDFLACEIVFRIVNLIEQTGKNGIKNPPKIKASTILYDNRQLSASYYADKNKTTWLKRHFKKALEILQTNTFLRSKYRGIELPDPNNSANIPTLKTLENVIYIFRYRSVEN